MVTSKKISDIIINSIIIFVLTIITLMCIAPVINTLAVSFSGSAAAASGTVYFWPKKFTLYSYEMLLGDIRFFRAFGVSLERIFLGGGLNFILTLIMAYPLSKEKKAFKARNIYMWIIVATMLFSGGLIPWYMVIKKTGLIDSIWALVLPGAVPVFNVILLVNFFRGVPKELEEAGIIDGAGPWYLLFKIYLPISLPAIATVTLFSIVNNWNAFFDGMILINNPDKIPLQTYIQSLVVDIAKMNLMSIDEIKKYKAVSNQTLNAAKIFVSIIPILAIYPFLQRYFITGIVMGSVKE